jgi:hypothetical protein
LLPLTLAFHRSGQLLRNCNIAMQKSDSQGLESVRPKMST